MQFIREAEYKIIINKYNTKIKDFFDCYKFLLDFKDVKLDKNYSIVIVILKIQIQIKYNILFKLNIKMLS